MHRLRQLMRQLPNCNHKSNLRKKLKIRQKGGEKADRPVAWVNRENKPKHLRRIK